MLATDRVRPIWHWPGAQGFPGRGRRFPTPYHPGGCVKEHTPPLFFLPFRARHSCHRKHIGSRAIRSRTQNLPFPVRPERASKHFPAPIQKGSRVLRTPSHVVRSCFLREPGLPFSKTQKMTPSSESSKTLLSSARAKGPAAADSHRHGGKPSASAPSKAKRSKSPASSLAPTPTSPHEHLQPGEVDPHVFVHGGGVCVSGWVHVHRRQRGKLLHQAPLSKVMSPASP